jgi:very-short-patch-repair endonuclease
MRSFKETYQAHQRQVELEQRAWLHRRRLTPSEAALWEQLRRRKLGVMFRRQVPLCGRYIADFYAPAVRLVIEVDGGSHRGRGCADALRDFVLFRTGVRVLRVSAGLVIRDVQKAVSLIAKALE